MGECFRHGVTEIISNGTVTSLNMPALPLDNDLFSKLLEKGAAGGSLTPEERAEVEKSSIRVPGYEINSLNNTVDNWVLRSGDERGQWFKLNLSVGETKTWKDFGFTHERVSASAGWLGFFSAVVDKSGKEEHLNIEHQETNIEIEVSFRGIAALDIQRGLW